MHEVVVVVRCFVVRDGVFVVFSESGPRFLDTGSAQAEVLGDLFCGVALVKKRFDLGVKDGKMLAPVVIPLVVAFVSGFAHL